jgi:hypothetical protein
MNRYWKYRHDGDLHIQYSQDVEKFGWEKLKEIAKAAQATGSVWDGPGDHRAEINSHQGVQYIAFVITDPSINKPCVVIETRERFEKAMNVSLTDLIAPASDGQHRHGAK